MIRQTVAGLAALFLGAGLLLLGHGMLQSLLSIRGDIEGFGATMIGGVGAAYYLGFFTGCIFLPQVMRRVGYIRTFSASGALVAGATLTLGLVVEPWAWLPVRASMGLAMATLFMTVESWLHGRVTNDTRGQIFSIYMVVNLGAATLAQQGLRLAPPGDLTLFGIAAVLICAGLLPVTLTRSEQPPTPAVVRLDLLSLFRLSPLGAVGCALSGLITAPFWALGPVYAQRLGHDLATATLFMSAVIAGGMIMQWPLGWVSDRIDRRTVLVAVFAAVTLVGGAMAMASHLQEAVWLAMAAAFGGTAFCINALCVSHVNDVMTDEDRISVSAGLLLLFGAGAVAGPLLAGAAMAFTGPGAMFWQIAGFAAVGFLFGLVRKKARPAPPDEQKEPFVAVPRTTPAVIPLDPRVPSEQAGFDEQTGELASDHEPDEWPDDYFGDRGS